MNRPWNKPFATFQNTETQENHKHYIPLGMRMIALRLYTPPAGDTETVRKVHCMQKSLYGNGKWFYFIKGFDIMEGADGIEQIAVDEGAFDSALCLYNGTREPVKNNKARIGRERLQNLNINAVIGENGTGKSTLIDMVVRMINNLSVAVFSENYIFSSAQHLHYIENVYASLAVYIDDKIELLTVKGHDVSLAFFERKNEEPDQQGRFVYCRQDGDMYLLKSNNHNAEGLIQGNRTTARYWLDKWFYTIVSNYSLYAYNYRDYFMERTSERKIEELRPQMDDVPKEEDYYWLKGVFHKNDGYQMPLVVYPMRHSGYINAAKENYLGKHNLIMLAFQRVTYKNSLGVTEYDGFPFREINQSHQVVSLYFTWKGSEEYEGFRNVYLDGKKIHEKGEQEKMDSLFRAYPDVRRYWARRLGICPVKEKCDEYFDRQHYVKRQAWDYAVAKTFKILKNYVVYSSDYKFFTEEYNKEQIESHLDKLVKDSTHRTRKLRQTLAFIKYFDGHYALNATRVDVDDIYQWMQKRVGESLYAGKDGEYHAIEITDLLPPPFCEDVQVGLVLKEKLEEYRNHRETFLDIIPFEGLSSGERQIAYTIGNLLYHTINIDSTVDDFNPSDTVHYRHLNILMDEVELYFHPDLQRRFVKLLVDALNQSTWEHISSMSITLITHSPFVLSDIPESNVLCLTKNEQQKTFDQTFAANIHDLFNNTFILPDTIGALAKSHIEKFVTCYDIQVRQWQDEDDRNEARTANQESLAWFDSNKDRFEYICSIIGDEYLREELSDMYDELARFYGFK